jgi:hypothetical protein
LIKRVSSPAAKRGAGSGAHPIRNVTAKSHGPSRRSPTLKVRTAARVPRANNLIAIPPRKRGRPSGSDGYHPGFAERTFRLMLLGLTQEEIAHHLDVSYAKFKGMIARHDDLRAAIKRALEADSNVAASMYQRACGYSHPEEKVFCTKDGEIVTYDTIKHYPPSEVAGMMWLSNRQKGLWRNQQSMDHTNSDGSFGAFTQAARQVGRQADPGRTLEHDSAEDAEVVDDEPTSPLRSSE